MLVDAPRVESGESDEDFHTMKLISYLCELSTDKKTGWQTRPVALVFTKADQCEHCFDDPPAFARRHTPGLVQQCRERLKRHQFFAVGVAGAVRLPQRAARPRPRAAADRAPRHRRAVQVAAG